MTDEDDKPRSPAPAEPLAPESPGAVRADERRGVDSHAASADSHPASAPPPLEPAPLDELQPDLWDRCAAWLMQSGALPALGLITLAMVVIYIDVFRGEVAGDDLTFHLAESARIADCLRAGDFDLWNPSANGGFASAYYYQVIPQLASALPAALFGHHLFFFQLSVFLPLVLAPVAAYRGMRLLGATPWQAAFAALAVGMLNGESRWGTGNAGTFQVGLYTQTWALAAFPIALGHAVRWATEARGLAPSIAWGAFVALCHPFAGVSLGLALIAGHVGRAVAGLFRGRTVDVDDDDRSLVPSLGERWRSLRRRPWAREFLRLAILAGCLCLAWMPIWLPLIVDYHGFGGFPHRVADEVGPGFQALGKWFASGGILDFKRPLVLTCLLPIVVVFARPQFGRWLWAPVVLYALMLGLGPHMPKTADDLVPAVRFLGAMQVLMALAIGAGSTAIARMLWDAETGSRLARAAPFVLALAGLAAAGFLGYSVVTATPDTMAHELARIITVGQLSPATARWVLLGVLIAIVAALLVVVWPPLHTQYGVRTGVAALAAALIVLLTLPGARALAMRVRVLDDFPGSHGEELRAITWLLQFQPPGRKQVGTGAENHWWNLLSYEYGRRPSLLMMGGGGLQASPNYAILWAMRDHAKNAWVYDAPYLVFHQNNADKMPPGELILRTKNYLVRRLRAPGLVSPVRVTGILPAGREAARAGAISWIKSDQPFRDNVLAYDGFGRPGDAPRGRVLRAFRQPSPGDDADMYAEVNVAVKSTFVARESWHPRWRVYIDRVAAPVRRVTPDFLAVDVPAGRHVLAFRFERPWWAHASWLAWPLVPLAAWLLTRTRRRRPMSMPPRAREPAAPPAPAPPAPRP
jgi:hypothetical protein